MVSEDQPVGDEEQNPRQEVKDGLESEDETLDTFPAPDNTVGQDEDHAEQSCAHWF